MGVKNVLITGVTGFLGQAIVSAYHARPDVKLFGHSRDVVKARAIFANLRIRIVDDAPGSILRDLKIDTVIHLAGIAHDLSNRYVSEDYFVVNDRATCSLYDSFLTSPAARFIFLSSIKAAVDIASSPVEEDVVPAPVSPYGQSKLNAEQYIQQHSSEGKKFYILRPCMIHGPGNKGNLNLLYKYVRSGLPFPLGAFENQRSFLSVDNLTFTILELIGGTVPSGVYHLADDGSMSTADLYRLISRTTRKSPTVLNIPRPLVKAGFQLLMKKKMLDKLTEDMLVSNAKIKKYLSRPLPTNLEDGLIKTIQSFDGA